MALTTIVVTSQKGGTGKSTLTTQLSVAAESDGISRSALIDFDPQGTTANWYNARTKETPLFLQPAPAEIPTAKRALDEAGIDWLFIDTPPAPPEFYPETRQVLENADFVVVPVCPSPLDLQTLPRTLELLKELQLPFAFVVNRANTMARITLSVMAALSESGKILDPVLRERTAYPSAMLTGESVLESRAYKAAAEDISALWANLRERIAATTRQRQ